MNSSDATPILHRALRKLFFINLQLLEPIFGGFGLREIDWYYNYACFYAKRGNKRLAIKFLDEYLGHDPRAFKDAEKDRDFRVLRKDEEFKQMLQNHRTVAPKVITYYFPRMFLLDITSLFVIVSVVVFLMDRQLGKLMLEAGIFLGFTIELVQDLVFRNRNFFGSITIPLYLGIGLFSFLNFVVYREGIILLEPLSYALVSLSGVILFPLQWFVFRPELKEYSAYRIQNLSYLGLVYAAPFVAALRAGKLLQAFSDGTCGTCIPYYILQVLFFSGIAILIYLLFDRGITLGRSQFVATAVTIAYLSIMSATFSYSNVFQADFLIYWIVVYTATLLLCLVVAIAEVYFDSNSHNQQRITRYLVAVYMLFLIIESLVSAAYGAGIIPNSIQVLKLQPIHLVMIVNLSLTAGLWFAFLKLKGGVIMGDNITISGITSASVNVGSPFAVALVTLQASGKDEMALTLMQLHDIVQGARFVDLSQQKNATEILDSIAEESQKPAPKKLSVLTLISALGSLLASAMTISEKAPTLLEKLRELWK